MSDKNVHQATEWKTGDNFYQQQHKVVSEKCQGQQLKKAGWDRQQVFPVPSAGCEFEDTTEVKTMKMKIFKKLKV